MEGMIGKKIGMTQVYDAEGRRTCVTVVEVGPCPVVQLKSLEKDGYVAAQLGYGTQKASRLTNSGTSSKSGSAVPIFAAAVEKPIIVNDAPMPYTSAKAHTHT